MSIHSKLQKSKIFKDSVFTKEMSEKEETISTGVISLNLLHSGRVKGGILRGAMNMISADSSLGKSFIGLSTLKQAQKQGMECIVLDSEKSFDYKWAGNIGIDTDPKKLTVVRQQDIVQIKQLLTNMVEGMTLDQRQNVFVLFDSWGTLISHVLLKKASEGSEAKDMSLPVWKNELANMMKATDVTFYVVNHVYDNTGGFGDPQKIPGGKRLFFNSESIVLGASKAKDKSGTDITGSIVTAKVAKGRKSIENTKLKYRIKHEGGLDPWYGFVDLAVEGGFVVKESGKFTRPCVEGDKKWFEKNIYCGDFWIPVFKNTELENYLNSKCSFVGRKIDISEDSEIDNI